MQPWDAAHTSKALKTTSTIRCDVRTLPPTTAADSEGSKIDPFGIQTLIGARHPYKMYHIICQFQLPLHYKTGEIAKRAAVTWLRGTSCPTMHLKQ